MPTKETLPKSITLPGGKVMEINYETEFQRILRESQEATRHIGEKRPADIPKNKPDRKPI